MAKLNARNLVVGLEVGSSKVAVLIGEILADTTLNIIGVGDIPSQGIENGGIKDLDAVKQCVRRAIDQAEMMADCKVSSVYLSLTGKHVSCQNETGMCSLPTFVVTQEDIASVVHMAKSVKISDEHRILHAIPQEFSTDHQEGIKKPLGLSGKRLDAKVHLITCHDSMANSTINSVEKCGVKVERVIFSGLSSSFAVLTEDEKELGVAVVDIGGGTIDIAVYANGFIQYSSVIPYAGNIVSNDIAYAFGAPSAEAEMVKIQYGCALAHLVDNDEMVEINCVGGRPARQIRRHTLSTVIEARYTELLGLINQELQKVQKNLKYQGIKYHLAAGVVLTGGASQIKGLVECAESIFHLPVRVGYPLGITGLTDYVQKTQYSTVVGLLHCKKQDFLTNGGFSNRKIAILAWIERITAWFKKEF